MLSNFLQRRGWADFFRKQHPGEKTEVINLSSIYSGLRFSPRRTG